MGEIGQHICLSALFRKFSNPIDDTTSGGLVGPASLPAADQ
jgi:hypothetical protein